MSYDALYPIGTTSTQFYRENIFLTSFHNIFENSYMDIICHKKLGIALSPPSHGLQYSLANQDVWVAIIASRVSKGLLSQGFLGVREPAVVACQMAQIASTPLDYH